MTKISRRIVSSFSRRSFGALLALISALLPASASAEDLAQVFDLARRHDASILAADAQYQASIPRLARAKGGLLPNIELVSSSTRSNSEADAMAGAIENRSNTMSLNLRQPLFNVALSTDVTLAQVASKRARLDYEITMQDFSLKVAQAYFDVLAAQDVLETKRLSKAAIAGQLDAAKRRFKAGLGIITDQEDAQARYSLAEADEVAAENDLRVSRLVLARLTGKPGIPVAAISPQLAFSWLAPGDLQDWLREARQHPAVLRAQLAVESARLNTRRARAEYLPRFDLVGAVTKNRVSGDNNPLSSLILGRSEGASIGVQVNLPIFSGFATNNHVKENVLLEQQAGNDLEATARFTEEAIERAYFGLQSALARVQALTAAEASSRNALAGTERAYKAGLRPNLDVLNAQSQLYQTRSDLDRVRYDVLMRSLALRAAAGGLRPESLVQLAKLAGSQN